MESGLHRMRKSIYLGSRQRFSRCIMHSRFICRCFSLPLFTVAAAAQTTSRAMPKITGISHLAVYTSDPAATDHYYREIIGAAKLPDPENPQGVRYAVNATQYIEVLPLPAGAGINRLDHTACNTDSAEGMRKYLAAKGWKTPAQCEQGSDGSRWFAVLDPEGNKVEFVQPPANAQGRRGTQRHRPSHHSCRLPGAWPRKGGHFLPRPAGLPALLVWRDGRRARSTG